MKKNAKTIVFLIVVFFGPLMVAGYFSFFGRDLVPIGKGARGNLINPATPLADFNLEHLPDRNPLGLKDINGKWTLATIVNGSCDRFCKDNLYKITQVRLAQGKHIERVQRLIIVDSDRTYQGIAHLLEDKNGLFVLLEPIAAQEGVVSQLRNASGAKAARQRIYVVDPLGNLMMYYENDADPSDIRKDLNKLLQTSQVG